MALDKFTSVALPPFSFIQISVIIPAIPLSYTRKRVQEARSRGLSQSKAAAGIRVESSDHQTELEPTASLMQPLPATSQT